MATVRGACAESFGRGVSALADPAFPDSRSLDSLVSRTSSGLSESCPPSPPVSARIKQCARADVRRWYQVQARRDADPMDADEVKVRCGLRESPRRSAPVALARRAKQTISRGAC